MKVPRENIKSIGLSVVYEPESRNDVNLDIILVHGLGGHPVKTWLHTPATEAPAKKPSSTNLAASSSENEPVRNLSLKYLASPNLKKGNTLKKPRNGEASPRLRVFGSPLRPRSVDFSDGAVGSSEHIMGLRPGRAPRRGSRRNRRAPPPRLSPPGGPNPALERWAGDEEEADEACDLATFWPTDLLPDLCCDARILTWGFRTRTADGMLVPGQLDIFSRGRDLLNDVNDLIASYREHGHSRELVFVAHSTGGIIIKEMLRLAHSYEDTQNRPLLASIAGMVFIGCPLRDSNNGTMVEAMKSMAAAAIRVELHDRVLNELLGADTPLAYDGRDAFEEIRHEYGFPVKTYRETVIIPPADDTLLPWVALALRRDSESLDAAKEEPEYIEADHLNMCRFASAGNGGYRSIASFILKVAHHQLLRLTTLLLQKHRLKPEEEVNLRLLAAPGIPANEPSQATTPTMVFPEVLTRKGPPWLIKHSAFRSWYHRKSPADRHKLLWLRGPAACGKSELLSSLISHISTEWSPTDHSSAIITVTVEGESLLEATIQKSDGAQKHNYDHRNANQDKQHTTIIRTPTDQSGKSRNNSSSPAGGPTHETASPLRTILQQLWAHDPRLRNLVGRLAKASSLLAREADSCAGPDRTQSDAGAREPQPQQPKVYSRRPNSGPGGGGINKGAQGPRRQAQPADAGGNKEEGRTVRENNGGQHDAEAAHADDHRFNSGQSQHQDHLDDARVVSFFLEDYLRLELPQTRAQASEEDSRAAGVKPKAEEEGKGKHGTESETKPDVVVDTPGTRRIFIFVDIAPTTAPATARDLLWCLSQLARRSKFSICVASRELDFSGMAIKHTDAYADALRGSPPPAAKVQEGLDDEGDEESTMLTVDVATSNAEDVASYIEATLLPDIEDRGVLAAKLSERSRGVMFWLEHAVAIVNDASEDGVSGEIVCSMLDDIAPEANGPPVAAVAGAGPTPPASRGRSGSSSSVTAAARAHDPGQARLDDLYAWKLRRLSIGEARAALVLMQWVMLAPEALRLNELLVAIRLTMLVWPQNGGDAQEQGSDLGARALDIEPPMSLKDLRRRPAGGAEYVPADNPSQFWLWARRISQGLVKLEGEGRSTVNSSNSKVSSEPLGLQRVVPAHESVRRFFLEGRGFQILTPPPPQSPSSSKTKQQQPTTEQLIDTSYYALLHTCLVYLNMTDFDSLSRARSSSNTASAHIRTPSEGPPSEAEEESTRLHRSNAEAQRALVTSSYPLLRYTVDNLLFHLLRPRALRYFPPQARLLRLLTADGCRIWRRWTRLLGIPDSSGGSGGDVPAAVLEKARARPSAAVLLRPVYGASFRIERVLRRACKTAKEQAALAARARARSRLRSQRSARSIKSAGGGGGGGDKAPPTPRTPTRPGMMLSASEQSVVFALMGGGDDASKAQWLVPKSPRSPRVRSDSLGSIGSSPMSNPASPGVLVGIQEV